MNANLDSTQSPVAPCQRVGLANPPVPVADVMHAPYAPTEPLRLLPFFARSMLDGGLPFGALSIARWSFRAARAVVPRAVIGALVSAGAIVGFDVDRSLATWRDRLLASARRTHAMMWLALMLFGGPAFRMAARLVQVERPGPVGRRALRALARVRELLGRDVLTIARDAGLPDIGPGLAARAYGNWTTIIDLLDPPTWFVLDRGPRIGLVTRWNGDHPERVREMAEDLAAQSYHRAALVVALEGIDRLPEGLNVGPVSISAVPAPCGSLALALDRVGGDYIGVVDLADRLHPHALLDLAAAIENDPTIDVVYGDEDWIGPRGRCLPHVKPDYSPELQRSTGYIGRPWLARRRLVEELGGLRPESVGQACEYDLMLRLGECGARFAHVPRVLYHWRLDAHAARDDDMRARALQAHLVRTHGGGSAERGLAVGVLRARPPARGGSVSIVIPNRDQAELIERCVRSVRSKSSYRDLEIVIVENGSTDPRVHELYRAFEADHQARIVVVQQPSFNFSRLVNVGVAASCGEFVVLLNNDTEVRAPGWIEAMLEHAQREDVGAVGARLLYPGGDVQHGGVVLGPGGLAGHVHRGLAGTSKGYAQRLVAVHEVSAVTAACLMVRRAVWDEMSGFEEALAVAYNDVHFCLGLRARGYRIIQTPHAELLHHENRSRGLPTTPEAVARERRESEWVQRRWPAAIARDPYLPRDFTAAWLFCAGTTEATYTTRRASALEAARA